MRKPSLLSIPGVGTNWREDWSNIIVYAGGDIAAGSNGNYYVSLNTHQGQDPTLTSGYWVEISDPVSQSSLQSARVASPSGQTPGNVWTVGEDGSSADFSAPTGSGISLTTLDHTTPIGVPVTVCTVPQNGAMSLWAYNPEGWTAAITMYLCGAYIEAFQSVTQISGADAATSGASGNLHQTVLNGQPFLSLGGTSDVQVLVDSAWAIVAPSPPVLPLTVVEGVNDWFTLGWEGTTTCIVAPGTYTTVPGLAAAMNDAVASVTAPFLVVPYGEGLAVDMQERRSGGNPGISISNGAPEDVLSSTGFTDGQVNTNDVDPLCTAGSVTILTQVSGG